MQLLRSAKEPPLVYVATSDRVSGDVSAGGGAVMISSEQLIRNIMKTDEEARLTALPPVINTAAKLWLTLSSPCCSGERDAAPQSGTSCRAGRAPHAGTA